jgi:hypothetical protein
VRSSRARRVGMVMVTMMFVGGPVATLCRFPSLLRRRSALRGEAVFGAAV